MSRVTLANLANLQNESSAVATINSNMAILQAALDQLLARDGQAPNTWLAAQDANSQRLINLPEPTSSTDPVRLGDLTQTTSGMLKATQAQAEAGALDTVAMTPLQTNHAVANGAFYNQGGTNAVSRSFTSKSKEFVSVLDYLPGQTPSATPSVNTAAFQSALDAVSAAGGGIVWVPPGTYIVSSTTSINVPSGVSLRGAGRQVTFIRVNAGLTIDLVTCFGSNTEVYGITFSGEDYSVGTATASGSAPAVTSTATAGGATTLTDGTKSWTTNQYAGFQVYITGGTGFNQRRTIASNTGTVLTVTSAWTTNPDATSTYRIEYVTITLTGLSGSVTAGYQIDGDVDIGNNAAVASYDSNTGIVTSTVGNAGAVTGSITFDGLYSLLAAGHGAQRVKIHGCNFIKFKKFAFAFNGITDLWFEDNYIKRTASSKRQNQGILGSSSWSANTRVRIINNTILNTAMDLSLNNSFIMFNVVDGFAFGAGITLEYDSYTYNVIDIGNICTNGSGTDVNLTCCEGWEVYAKNSIHALNIGTGNSGPGMAMDGDYGVIGLNIMADNGNTQHDSGITVNYAGAGATGSYNVIGMNVGYNTIGASGPQGYGLNIANASSYYNVVGLNNFNNLRTRPTNNSGSVTQELTPILNGSEPSINPGTITNGSTYGPVAVNVAGCKGDNKYFAGFSQDLKGCVIWATWHSDNLAYVYIRNETGSSQTLSSGTIYVSALYSQGYPNF